MAREATSTSTSPIDDLEGTMDHVEDCDALVVEVARFASVMSALPLDQDISTCPGWTVLDLAEHLGVIHRWAEELVRRRSPARIARAPLENRDAVSPEWIIEGGERLVATLLAANPDDEMWAWGLDQHVRFWSRRQLHETLVHRMDLELAAQVSPRADPAMAADAIDEFLGNVEKVGAHSSELAQLRGHGEKLALRASDSETLWVVTFDDDGFRVSNDDDSFDAELIGSSVDLLLVTLRRRSVDQGGVELKGERQLVDFWLEHSAFD
jgi:uncharacterized protein (TIGR03083 family)